MSLAGGDDDDGGRPPGTSQAPPAGADSGSVRQISAKQGLDATVTISRQKIIKAMAGDGPVKRATIATSVSWEELPRELWESIFTKLKLDNSENALKPISLVCKRFLTISNRCKCFLTISYRTCHSVYTSFQCKSSPLRRAIYSRFPFIKSITLRRFDFDLDGTMTQLAHSNIPLQSLTLSGQLRFPKKAMSLIGQRMNKTLRSLSCLLFEIITNDDLAIVAKDFSYLNEFGISCSISGRGRFCCSSDQPDSISEHVTDKGIWQILTKLKSLVSLSIINQVHVSHQSIEYLATYCHSLRELRVGVNYPGYYSSIRLDQLQELNLFHSLSSLELSGLTISEDLLIKLSETGLKVKELELNNLEYLVNVPGEMFCKFLKSCVSLVHLKMKPFSFPYTTSALDFAESVPFIQSIHLVESYYLQLMPHKFLYYLFLRCPLLEEISFSHRFLGIGKEWFKVDPPLAPVCLVRNLYFACDDLCDETLEAILSICPKLEDLAIYSCPRVTLEGIKAAIMHCRNIKHVYVDGPNNLLNSF